MGTICLTQHSLLNKQTKPCFDIPHDKLIDLQKLKSKARPLRQALKVPSHSVPNRKDLAANWDESS